MSLAILLQKRQFLLLPLTSFPVPHAQGDVSPCL